MPGHSERVRLRSGVRTPPTVQSRTWSTHRRGRSDPMSAMELHLDRRYAADRTPGSLRHTMCRLVVYTRGDTAPYFWYGSLCLHHADSAIESNRGMIPTTAQQHGNVSCWLSFLGAGSRSTCGSSLIESHPRNRPGSQFAVDAFPTTGLARRDIFRLTMLHIEKPCQPIPMIRAFVVD